MLLSSSQQSGVRVGVILYVYPQFSAGEEITQVGCSTVRNGKLVDIHAHPISVSEVVQWGSMWRC